MDATTHGRFYDDIDTFFAAIGLKRRGERGDGEWIEDSYDYGVWWMDDQRRPHRLTWIGGQGREPGDGGEVYLVRLTGGRTVPLAALDGVMVTAGDAGGLVELLGVIRPRAERPHDGDAEAVLDGWAEECGQTGSVGWVRERMAQAIADGRALPPS